MGRVARPSPLFSFPITNRGCPILAFFARACPERSRRGGLRCCWYAELVMPRGLRRYYGAHHLHFITCSCYRRLPLLRTARSRDRFLSVLEQTRQRYRFVVVGYGVMPEHIHLLISEPEVGTPSTVMQVLKQRTARALLPKQSGAIRVRSNCLRRLQNVRRSGRAASTTSTFGHRRSGSRNFVTCTVTPLNEA